jgi:hypothetical protein
MPLAANPMFLGRTRELLQIARALRGGDTVALGQVVAATGLGGLGKTQLAVELFTVTAATSPVASSGSASPALRRSPSRSPTSLALARWG